MIIEESQWGHRQWQLMRVRLFRETCLVIITEQCEACSIQQLNNAFVQLFNHWTIWSIFGTSMDDNDTGEETRVVVQINLFGDYYWTMWSLFSSTVEQCEVRSIVQSLDSLEWIQFQISAPPSSIFIAQIWTRMRMRWSTWPLMLLTRITNISGATETTRETGLVWDSFTTQSGNKMWLQQTI